MDSEATKTVEQAREQYDRVRVVQVSAAAELAEVREALDTQLDEERRYTEEAARAGRPAKPRKKVRDLRERSEELERELATLGRLLPRLELESLEAELEEKRSEQRALEGEFAASEARLREAEAAHQEVQGRIHVAVEERRDIGHRLREAGDRLAAQDPAVHERRLQEAEQRAEEYDRAMAVHNERYRREMLAEGGFRPAERG